MDNSNLFDKIYRFIIWPIIVFFKVIFRAIYLSIIWLKNQIVNKFRFSISFKITFTYLRIMTSVFMLCSLLIIATFSYYKFAPIVNNNISYINSIVSSGNIETIIDLTTNQNIGITVFDKSKKPIHINNSDFSKYYINFSPIRVVNHQYYYVSQYTSIINNNQYYFFIHNNVTNQIDDIIVIAFNLFIAYLFGILLTTLVGSLSNKKVLLPINKMTQTIKEISAQNLNTRINISGSQDELKDLARAFNETINKIEESYNKQQQFVSDASHELRTPISVLQGYANMLKRWGKNDASVLEESIDAIYDESESMKDLVEKLLFIARNDKDTLKIQKEKFSLSKLLTVIIKETKMIDSNHSIKLENFNDVYINADKNMIKQAIRVFIDNAIKYTDKGSEIITSLSLENEYAVVTVKDNGCGISNADINHIFDRFYRTDKSRTKENGGHGLGLSIAKIIILRHGGKIKVRSKINAGTEFKIYIPQ